MAAWTLPLRTAQWINQLSIGLDRRSRKYLPVMVLGSGRRTVSCWLRAAGVSDDWQVHYYFLQTLGRSAGRVALELLLVVVRQIPARHVGPYVTLVIDDSPTKRYRPQVERAGIHHNPTPGPAGAKSLYGHVWVTLSWLVNHPRWGGIGLPSRAVMYARRKDLQPLEEAGRAPWRFRTKLELAAELVEWCVELVRNRFERNSDRVRLARDHGDRYWLSQALQITLQGAIVPDNHSYPPQPPHGQAAAGNVIELL